MSGEGPNQATGLGIPQLSGMIATSSTRQDPSAIGGKDNTSNHVDTVEVYDPRTNSWTTEASMPTARAALAAAGWNGKIYASGGEDAPAGNILFVMEEFTPGIFYDVHDANYLYDGLYRLTDCLFSDGRRIFYDYDPAGNRIEKIVTSQVLASLGANSGPVADVTNGQPGVEMLQLHLARLGT